MAVSLTGTLGFSGALGKVQSLHRGPSGHLFLYGNVARSAMRSTSVSGTLRFSTGLGIVVHKIPVFKNIYGTVRFSGNVSSTKVTSSNRSGTLTFSSSLNKGIGKSGTLCLAGAIKNDVYTNLDGTVNFGGDIVPMQFNFGVVTFSGGLLLDSEKTTSGTLNLSGIVECPQNRNGILSLKGSLATHTSFATSGTLNLRGLLQVPSQKAFSGRLSFMRVLTYVHTPYSYEDVSVMNMAASYDLEIEQGTTFQRTFRWIKSDGIPFDLSYFSLFMTIRSYKNANSIILSTTGVSGINIVKSVTDRGVFTINISSSVTTDLDFTRASYDIVAKWGTSSTARLVEGTIILSRGVTFGVTSYKTVNGTVYFSGDFAKPLFIKANSGIISFSGGLSKRSDRLRSHSGTLQMQGSLNKVIPAPISGSVLLIGSVLPALSERTSGTVTFSGDPSPLLNKSLSGTVLMMRDI